MSAFTPSPYQQALFDFIATGTGSAIVKAVAGSGKTTSVIKCLPFIPDGAAVHLFAFNTTIAKELNNRIDALRQETGRPFAGVRASTFHSAGYGVLRYYLTRQGVTTQDPDSNKLRNLCRAWVEDRVAQVAPDLRENERLIAQADMAMYGSFICKLVGLARGEGIGALVGNDDWRWMDLISHHDLSFDVAGADEGTAIRMAQELLIRSNKAALAGHIDFDDQLYLPLLWRLRLRQNDYVFVDEAQDTNPVRRAICKLCLRPGGRLIAVGDPMQAIYGFTGASADALALIAKEFACKELPLTVSYRCSKAVVALAQTIVPYINSAPGAEDGKVEALSMCDTLKALTAQDAILCRNTAPLVKLAFQLIAGGRACTILGRDIGKGLVDLIEKQRARGVDALMTKLNDYQVKEVAKFTAKGEEQKAESLVDRIDCIRTVAESLPVTERTVPALVNKINGLFSDATGGILTLATVHRAKGKEWPSVAILEPNLMPSRWARQDWQQEQERNLQYVAWTRAKAHLIEILPPDAAKKDGVAGGEGKRAA